MLSIVVIAEGNQENLSVRNKKGYCMKIAIGTDHRGFVLKNELLVQTEFAGVSVSWIDCGTFGPERTDYPVYANKVCTEILAGRADMGILLCGSGVGMSIAANRFRGIYAALAWNDAIAHQSKRDDSANILVIPADEINIEQARSMIGIWLTTKFLGNEYQKRLLMIDRERAD